MSTTVVIGLYGVTLDRGGKKRWERWRPTISLVRHDDFIVDRFELLVQKQYVMQARSVIDDMKTVSPETQVHIHEVEMADPWDLDEVFSVLHGWAREYPFDPDHEDYLVHITTGTHVAQICMFLLTEARYLPGRLIQTSPPSRAEPESPGTYRVIDLDLSKYDHIASRFQKEQEESLVFLKSGIETRNKNFNYLIEQIEKVAIRSKAPILLTGPTGAGKSQLARRIFELKKQRRQVTGHFAEINCATLRGDAAMSALFGHVRGAFTGAAGDRPGLLRAADKGVLFLDEIGELGMDEQAMLLRAIEEKRFLPVGSDREVTSDFQLLAGTNRDLQREVEKGDFREDLLARINLWTFRLPSLRERPEDIPPNLAYELEQYARKNGRMVTFNKEAYEAYLRFAQGPEGSWRANFRDLNASIIRMATLTPGGRINQEVAREEMNRLRTSWQRSDERFGILREYLSPEAIEEIDLFDRAQLSEVLAVVRESKSLAEAGRKLFAASRLRKKSANDSDRLRKYLARFELTPQDVME